MANYLFCRNIDQLSLIGSSAVKQHPDPINIWSISVENQLRHITRLEGVLTPEEKAQAARYHQKKDMLQFIVTRAALRFLLAEVISCRPEEVNIITAAGHHKPQLSGKTGIYFNISHSNQRAVIAIGTGEIGIDLEYVQPDFEYLSVAEFAFSAMESDSLLRHENPLKEFFRLWTRKEAFLKGLGTGLINDLKLINCLDNENIIPAHVAGVKADWAVTTVELIPDYLMSIAHEQLPAVKQINLNTDEDLFTRSYKSDFSF
ncbi:4'-phosphopantetheinyl transferase family protein [Pedobacter hartonius]|uniref:4'-phosphopantetheinyl transferase n=1 Tax=Pedobacter hartonius TaxID=425514 RepID=A0A1H4GK08_9SPHI|nr:4'-phosphopantetheinyl transferase superfamily protein [Pedobacter hartonius]SEB09002.1 4'-phosphopantetheinyl transferase [Pedobacter hartonius]